MRNFIFCILLLGTQSILAKQNNVIFFNEGMSYLYGNKEIGRDYNKAFQIFSQLCNDGYEIAGYCLGLCYANGQGVPKDEAKALAIYKQYASMGEPCAIDCVGDCYYYGIGTTQDKELAQQYYKKAFKVLLKIAQTNNSEIRPQYPSRYVYDIWKRVGGGYFTGNGTEKNTSEAISWYHKAAEHGDQDAQNNLGYIYYEGEEVEKDIIEAISWFRKSAEQGNVVAQCILGFLYYNGGDVERNLTESVNWYRKAAEQGHPDAQCQLGNFFYNGEGVEKDAVEAVKWFRRAAIQGVSRAQNILAECYENGYGVTQDMNEATKWRNMAGRQGNTDTEFDLPDSAIVDDIIIVEEFDFPDSAIVDDTTIHDNVEQMPEFPGGISALMGFLSRNIKYPKEAEENGIQGRVIVSFVVEKDGSITDIQVVKPVELSINKEAIRVASLMPKWIPGKHDGTEVRVKYTMPITFRLQ